MSESSSFKSKASGLGAPGQVEGVPLVALAMQLSWKVAVAKRGFLKAQRRGMALSVAGLAVVRRGVACAVAWLGGQDENSTNYLKKLVVACGIKALLQFSIFLVQVSILLLDRRYLVLQRIERLSDLIHLLHQCELDLYDIGLIARCDKPVCNGCDAG